MFAIELQQHEHEKHGAVMPTNDCSNDLRLPLTFLALGDATTVVPLQPRKQKDYCSNTYFSEEFDAPTETMDDDSNTFSHGPSLYAEFSVLHATSPLEQSGILERLVTPEKNNGTCISMRLSPTTNPFQWKNGIDSSSQYRQSLYSIQAHPNATEAQSKSDGYNFCGHTLETPNAAKYCVAGLNSPPSICRRGGGGCQEEEDDDMMSCENMPPRRILLPDF